MNHHTCYRTLVRPWSRQITKISSLGHAVLPVIIGLVSLLSISCASMGGGSTRSLGHVYQDDRGMTFITLFDMGDEAKGVARTFGHVRSRKELTLSLAEFESLWGTFDESKLARYIVKKGSDTFETKNNYVILKGMLPGGSVTYVIPKSEAPESVRKWVKLFREKTRS